MEKIIYPSRRSNDPQEISLAIFCHKLREKYRHGELKKVIINLCEKIPEWKWKTEYNWCSKKEFIQWCKDNEIKTQKDFINWKKKNKRPDYIPSHPDYIYEEWSWSILSGNHNKKNNWCSKKEFIQWCKDNEIRTSIKFGKWCRKNKRPNYIPYEPNRQYSNWSWGDLSGKYVKRNFCSKKEFIKWCKDNGIRTQRDFENFKDKKPKKIGYPSYVYKDWSWGDLSGRYKNKDWASKKEFIKWCEDNGIKSYGDFINWKKKNKRPINITSQPQKIYEKWEWYEVSGKERNRRRFNLNKVSKEEFIKWCKDNGVKSGVHFYTLDRPINLPFDPHHTYKNFSWNDIKEKKFISKEEFIQWCKNNNIKKWKDFYNLTKEIREEHNLPSTPNQVYNFYWGEISGFNKGNRRKRRKYKKGGKNHE